METRQVKEIIRRELPGILQDDAEMQRFILRLSRKHFAPKEETASHFDRLLDELRTDREEQSKRWEAQETKWDDQNKKWDDQNKKQNKKWDDQNKKWHENQEAINRMIGSIEDLARKHDSTIGALGSRWGLHSEQSFRNALKGILEKVSGDAQVLNVVEYDDDGDVFGRPDQVELDIIVKNGLLIICEIKSSMSKADMYVFERKVRFYEKKHNRKATGIMVISPMVDKRAQAVADKLAINVYSYADTVDPEIFDL